MMLTGAMLKHFNYSFFLELYYRYKRVSLEKKYFPVPDGFQIRFQDHSTAVVADYFQLFPCSYFQFSLFPCFHLHHVILFGFACICKQLAIYCS